MIATVTLNPALDKKIFVDTLLFNDTNHIQKVNTDIGGKGINASRMLKELGCPTVTLGFVGGHTGKFVEHVLTTQSIATDFVHVDDETRTNFDILESDNAVPTAFDAPGPTVSEDDIDELLVKVRKIARKSDMVILGGSLTRGLPVDFYARLVAQVKEAGSRAILDSDGEAMCKGMEAVPFMIKPNKDETRHLTGIDINFDADLKQALDTLAKNGIQLVIISLGAKGAAARTDDGIWFADPPKVKAVSTIGSGDSMVAGIASVVSRGGSISDALRWGTAAGAATAMNDGTELGHRDQIMELLDKVNVRQL